MASEERRQAVVQFALQEDELMAIEYTALQVLGPRNFMVANAPLNAATLEPVVGGRPKLEIYLDEDDLQAARQRAEWLYREIRSDARLPDNPPEILEVFFQSGTWARADEFVDDAYD